MKKRSLILMAVLSVFTLGIYWIYWYMVFHKEARNTTGKGVAGILHFLGLFTFIYVLVWSYRTSKRLNEAAGGEGVDVYMPIGVMYPIRIGGTDRAILAMFFPTLLLQAQGNEVAALNG